VDRGDIFIVDLEPTMGSEQRGHRPVLVVSRAKFNTLGVAWVVPITQGGGSARAAGFSVSLAGCGTDTQGVALCHQVRSVDLNARKARLKERLPDPILGLVLDRLRAVLD
jgi:mRNA interferase ChpB